MKLSARSNDNLCEINKRDMKTSGKKIGLKERAIKPPFRKTTLFQRVVLVAGLVSLLSAQLWRKWMFNKLAGQMKIFRDHGDNDIPLSGYSSDSNEPWASVCLGFFQFYPVKKF